MLCRGKVFMGTHNSIPGINMPHSLNGSFIFPNGTVVLADADVEAYINGTLVFYSGELQ